MFLKVGVVLWSGNNSVVSADLKVFQMNEKLLQRKSISWLFLLWFTANTIKINVFKASYSTSPGVSILFFPRLVLPLENDSIFSVLFSP